MKNKVHKMKYYTQDEIWGYGIYRSLCGSVISIDLSEEEEKVTCKTCLKIMKKKETFNNTVPGFDDKITEFKNKVIKIEKRMIANGIDPSDYFFDLEASRSEKYIYRIVVRKKK